MNCIEREKKRPDTREPKLLELCVIPLADEEFVCWENTKHPNCQNNKKYCHSLLGFLLFIQEIICNKCIFIYSNNIAARDCDTE